MSEALVYSPVAPSKRATLEFTASAVVTVLVIGIGCWIAVYGQPHRDRVAESELRAFASTVHLGDSIDSGRKAFDDARYPHLTWVSTFHPYFVVKTPPRAGAYNWVTWIEERDGKVAGIFMREWRKRTQFPVQDNRPEPAPKDQSVPGVSQWPKGLNYEYAL